MKRTAPAVLLSALLAGIPCLGQEPDKAATTNAQDDAIQGLVDRMRAAEAAARSVQLDLQTEGKMPGNLEFRTKGQLRVLRAEQGGVTAVHSLFEYSFADGLAGRMESVKTAEGVLVLEHSPTFGELFLRFEPALVADLEWAGRMLQRNDLPGLGDARATAPLGSEMVADLQRRYALQPLSNKERKGMEGTWIGGDRRPEVDPQQDSGDQPLADHVELFVRKQDDALLEVAFLQMGKVVQRIQVDKLVIGEPMLIDSFRIDARGKKPKDVKEHQPAWEQIQQILQGARGKAPEGELPPSERGK